MKNGDDLEEGCWTAKAPIIDSTLPARAKWMRLVAPHRLMLLAFTLLGYSLALGFVFFTVNVREQQRERQWKKDQDKGTAIKSVSQGYINLIAKPVIIHHVPYKSQLRKLKQDVNLVKSVQNSADKEGMHCRA